MLQCYIFRPKRINIKQWYFHILFIAQTNQRCFFCLDRKISECMHYSWKNIIIATTISATPLYNAYHGGTYFYISMLTYTKQPISIADQMSILKSRGLLFDNEQATVECLKFISYFRLANYWKPSKSKITDGCSSKRMSICCFAVMA